MRLGIFSRGPFLSLIVLLYKVDEILNMAFHNKVGAIGKI